MTFRQKKHLGLALAMIGAIALSACASSKPDRRDRPQERAGQERPQRTSGTFMQPSAVLFTAMDSNQDKRVSRAEMQAGVKAEWEKFGSNPSAIQFSKWSLETLGSTDAFPTFMSFDKDFNGVIYESEFMSGLERTFTRLDKNGDDIIERSEMIIAFNAQEGQRRQRGGQGGERGQRGGGEGGGGRPPR